jgi:hypothetical protein
MVAADPGRADIELFRLADPPLSAGRIAELIHLLDPILDPQSPERLACTHSLWSFLEWVHRPEFDGERLRQLVEAWELARLQGGLVPMDPWREHERELATRLACALEAVRLVQEAVAIYDQTIGREMNKFWWRALARHRITLKAEAARRLERGRDAIPKLDVARGDSDRHAQQLRGRFEVELERWRHLGGEWSRAWLGELEAEVETYWTIRLPESQDRWSRSRSALSARLQVFFEVLGQAMAPARVRADDMIIILSRATCDRLRESRALISPVLSTAPALGPAFEVEADSMLRRLASRGATREEQPEGGQQAPLGPTK